MKSPLKSDWFLSVPGRAIYIGLIVLVLLLIWNCPTNAQGIIHLSAGDSYLFTQPTLVQAQIDEGGGTFISVLVRVSGDLFTAGDSLQMDVFSTLTALSPLATGSVTNPPWTITGGASLQWLGQPWDAPSGAIRITMLSGSVDISSVEATSAHDFFRGNYSYTIPEPSVSLLLAPGLVWLLLRQRKFG